MARWEQRWHPLREEWVIIAAHRQDRPWHGEIASSAPSSESTTAEYLESCYLCPGNQRVGGGRNEHYRQIFVFDNDHPCVGPEAPRHLEHPPGIYRNRPADGLARVVCYSPKHNTTLAELSLQEIEALLLTWQRICRIGPSPRSESCADLREQRRGRRCVEHPSALPDLRDEFRVQDDRNGSCGHAQSLRQYGACAFSGHSVG